MSDLPSGTVTFLFTDIEGSTRLWEERPEAMGEALARHDEIVRSAIEASGGYVFATGGDSFAAAFDTTSDAVESVLAAQEGLSSDPATKALPVLVRMGIHTGTATERNGDYFGPTVNRAARVSALAHGGQVLLSAEAAGLVAGALPEGSAVVDRGRHRLADIGSEHSISELEHGSLSGFGRPLQSVGDVGNLPTPPTSLHGREQAVAEALEGLEEHRLVTITGTGGVGKTRLAVEVAAKARGDFTDERWFVDLVKLGEPENIVAHTARELGIQSRKGDVDLRGLVGSLQARRALVVLDNCEHVVDAAADLAEELVQSCPGLRVLATSREALAVDGEAVVALAPLHVGEERGPAVELFCDRAPHISSFDDLDEHEREGIRELVELLDGLPLAIELAAARASTMTPAEMAERLDERFRLLDGGTRRARRRQRTLSETLKWSFDLLSESEQLLFELLGVFSGGFTLAAVERMVAPFEIESGDAADDLTSLLEKSLVDRVDQGTRTRFRLLETTRDYCLDRLAERGLLSAARAAHVDQTIELVEEIVRGLSGPDEVAASHRLTDEFANISAAVAWTCDGEDVESALRLVTPFLHVVAYHGDRIDSLARAAAEVEGVEDHELYPDLLTILAFLANLGADVEGSLAQFQRAAAICERLERDAHPATFNLAANTLIGLDDPEEAFNLAQKAVEQSERDGNKYWLSMSRVALSLYGRFLDRDPEELRRNAQLGYDLGAEVGGSSARFGGAVGMAMLHEHLGTASTEEVVALWDEAASAGDLVDSQFMSCASRAFAADLLATAGLWAESLVRVVDGLARVRSSADRLLSQNLMQSAAGGLVGQDPTLAARVWGNVGRPDTKNLYRQPINRFTQAEGRRILGDKEFEAMADAGAAESFEELEAEVLAYCEAHGIVA